jgi:adenosine kinase
MIADRV